MYYSSVFLISLGAIITFLSLFKWLQMIKSFQSFKDSYSNVFIKISKINFEILIVFFLCYITFDIFTIFNFTVDNILFIAVILFFASIFILMSTHIQIEMSSNVIKAHLETVNCLINSVEARDLYTKEHSEHVANLVSIIYKHLPKIYKKDLCLNSLRTAGWLHDIGKIGVPETILNKNGSLNELEWQCAKDHPLTGRNILCSSMHLTLVSEWVYYHHERVDGNGYYKIKNEDIPFASKILSIADTYSALVTARPYRTAISHDKAIGILKSSAGTQLDSYLVTLFCSISKKEIDHCNPQINLIKGII